MSFARGAFALGCIALAAAAACNLTVDTDGLSSTQRGFDGSMGADASPFDATVAIAAADANADAADASNGVTGNDSGNEQMDGSTAKDAAPAVDPDLVGKWSFDEEAGALWADNESANDPTDLDKAYFAGGAGIGVKGRTGGALVPNGGTGDVKAIDNANFPQTGTLSFWIAHPLPPDGGESGSMDGVFSYGYDANSFHFYTTYQGNNEYAFVLQGPGPASVCPKPTDYCSYGNAIVVKPDSTGWTHVVWTWDFSKGPGTVTVYANAQLQPDAIFSGSTGGDGGTLNQSLVLEGNTGISFDDVKLYKRVLSLDEIIALQ